MPIPEKKKKIITTREELDEIQDMSDELTLEDILPNDELDDENCDLSTENTKQKSTPFVFHNYDLSVLNDEERTRFIKMQINEEQIGNFYMSYKTMYNLHNDPDYMPHLEKRWGFPATKAYWGWIYNFEEVINRYNEETFQLEFLANSCDIVYLRFRRSFSDAIYNSIKKFFDLRDNIFHKADFSIINGCAVCMFVDNVQTSKGTSYSKVLNFRVINNDDADLILKVAKEMFKQSS